MKRLLIGICTLYVLPALALAAQIENAGFVQGLWYSDYTPLVDEPVRIYAAVRNNSGADLTGTVNFYVGEERIERKSVAALDGRIVETWADWTPDYGEHTIRAELTRVVLSSANGDEGRSDVSATLAEDIIFVDRDTDGDGIGNQEDRDDDGDGISDEDEAEQHTDPLNPNDPPPQDDDEKEDEASGDEPEAVVTDNDTVAPAETANAGLEQYLAPSRANNILTSITDWATGRKTSLDAYREDQSQQLTPEESLEDVTVNADGFGEITRRDTSDDPPRPTEGTDSVIGDLMAMIGTVIGAGIALVLGIVSYVLGHPMLLQFGLLLLLLFATLRVARFFGKRPSN